MKAYWRANSPSPEFHASPPSCRALADRFRKAGTLTTIGVEGTGSNRPGFGPPSAHARAQPGKVDPARSQAPGARQVRPLGAYPAARAVVSGSATQRRRESEQGRGSGPWQRGSPHGNLPLYALASMVGGGGPVPLAILICLLQANHEDARRRPLFGSVSTPRSHVPVPKVRSRRGSRQSMDLTALGGRSPRGRLPHGAGCCR